MKLFGYSFNERQGKPLKLREITFSTNSPRKLRLISKFLLDAAVLLEKKVNFGHLHLQDDNKNWEKYLKEGAPDVIVFNERNKPKKSKKRTPKSPRR